MNIPKTAIRRKTSFPLSDQDNHYQHEVAEDHLQVVQSLRKQGNSQVNIRYQPSLPLTFIELLQYFFNKSHFSSFKGTIYIHRGRNILPNSTTTLNLTGTNLNQLELVEVRVGLCFHMSCKKTHSSIRTKTPHLATATRNSSSCLLFGDCPKNV